MPCRPTATSLWCSPIRNEQPPFTPHPWNQDFAWRPATSTPAALTPEQTEEFNRQGFFVMEDLLDADTIAAVIRRNRRHRG